MTSNPALGAEASQIILGKTLFLSLRNKAMANDFWKKSYQEN